MNHLSHVDTQAELDAYIASLPVDEEPLSEEDADAILQGRAAIARGEVLSGAQLHQRLAIADLLDSLTEGGSYPLWDLHRVLVQQGIVPADSDQQSLRVLLDEMVKDEFISGNSEPRYWKQGREYSPLP